MAKYLFLYHGNPMTEGQAPSPEVMAAWGAWFGSLGSALIDGGNPVGASSTVQADGSLKHEGGANPVTGYSLIEASSLEDAHQKAAGCPLLKVGGSVEIAPALSM